MKNEQEIRDKVRSLVSYRKPENDNKTDPTEALVRVIYALIFLVAIVVLVDKIHGFFIKG